MTPTQALQDLRRRLIDYGAEENKTPLTKMLQVVDEGLAGSDAMAEAQSERLREALGEIARGVTPPEQHGHYLAHREAVRIARLALQGQSHDRKEMPDES